MDLEALMPVYAHDIRRRSTSSRRCSTSGAQAKRQNWRPKVFTMYQRPLGYEVRDLAIRTCVADRRSRLGDSAVAHRLLARLSGTEERAERRLLGSMDDGLAQGRRDWRIVHDQISVPVDFETGKALLNLQP